MKGHKKLFPDLPFGNMDSDRVEARKSLLESFLKVSILCCHCSRQIPKPRWGDPGPGVLSEVLLVSLQQLCAIPEIANSEEMQEFLALNTDARIAFVKKPFVVSRIDKV